MFRDREEKILLNGDGQRAPTGGARTTYTAVDGASEAADSGSDSWFAETQLVIRTAGPLVLAIAGE